MIALTFLFYGIHNFEEYLTGILQIIPSIGICLMFWEEGSRDKVTFSDILVISCPTVHAINMIFHDANLDCMAQVSSLFASFLHCEVANHSSVL
jgi:hypothetical protein